MWIVIYALNSFTLCFHKVNQTNGFWLLHTSNHCSCNHSFHDSVVMKLFLIWLQCLQRFDKQAWISDFSILQLLLQTILFGQNLYIGKVGYYIFNLVIQLPTNYRNIVIITYYTQTVHRVKIYTMILCRIILSFSLITYRYIYQKHKYTCHSKRQWDDMEVLAHGNIFCVICI